MIIFKTLKWDNCFSYAENNLLKLDENSITQLIGTNGAGKTSISLILQEVLYGRNIKGIKKQDIANRNTGRPGYGIELEFSKDANNYRIVLNRKSSLKLHLYKDGEDISSHTSINTYKTIADIIGISDFKTFMQLLYQSSTDSLEFLTATDTNRKKFLISLLMLERYVELHEIFKAKVKEVNDDIRELNGAIGNITSWLDRHANFDTTEKELEEVPTLDQQLIDDLGKLKNDLNDIRQINIKINSNNEYKRLLEEIDVSIINQNIEDPSSKIKQLEKEHSTTKAHMRHPQTMIDKLNKLQGVCPTCMQDIDPEHTGELLSQYNAEIENLQVEAENVQKQLKELKTQKAQFDNKKRIEREFERLYNLVDKDLPSTPKNKETLEQDIKKLQSKILNVQNTIKEVSSRNAEAAAHNSKIKVILEQIDEFNEQLNEKTSLLQDKEEMQNILDLLKNTFSTHGLISYKIESSVKELEKVINEYLAEFGHFQIFFKLAGDKLNIEVMDSAGNNTGIESLSSGERARVNIATVLAIRKIMTSLTSTKINLLFLDEIVGVVDGEGKEKLAEVLLQEKLNTFMVSHEWEHPLIEKIYITKEDNISRIEHA